jgi:hypothetical protein
MPGGEGESRIALVVGNADYKAATVLANPVNDALRMAAALDRLGFKVTFARNCDISEFNKSLRNFTRNLIGSDVGLLYYSGHALQFDGENYLIPIDARLEEPDDLERGAFKLSQQLAAMRSAARLSLVFLDACRDDPFKLDHAGPSAGTKRVIVRRPGLKEVEKADLKDALIAFAAEQGHTAVDGTEGSLSPFTKALVDHIETPGLEVTKMMRLVKQRVREATNGKQSPWSNDSLTKEFFFKPPMAANAEVHSPNQPEGDRTRVELPPADESPVYRDALDPATFDVPRGLIQCIVVLAEEAADEDRIPLQEHVRRAWDFHGDDIAAAVVKYRAKQGGRHLYDADARQRAERALSCLRVDQAFANVTSLTRAVEAICKADVAVFDTTEFRQPGVMLLLGVRSVARRGVTICSLGGNYVIGAELTIPFNLQMLNLAAHSAAQEDQGMDPRDLIGKKIANGFRELAELPQYLDLPAYDSVRRIGGESKAYRPIQYFDQILLLCPFSQEYSGRNWKRYLSKELPGKLKEHFRKVDGSRQDTEPRIVRLMDLNTPRLVAQTLYEAIRLTDMCVIDWTGLRSNVMFEAGVRLATNPLGAVHIVGETEPSELGDSKVTHVEHMFKLFEPVVYSCKPGRTAAYLQMIERFEKSLGKGPDAFESLVYRTVGGSLDDEANTTAVPVVEELISSANLLLSDDESSGICPVLFHDVNKRILEEAQEAASERRLAAWLYLERRVSDVAIRGDEQLYTQFRTLGAQARRWLKKRPDAALDEYIKERMRQVKEQVGKDDDRGNP